MSRKAVFFLICTLMLSGIFYALIFRAGGLEGQGGLLVIGLMWAPGLSAILTQLVHHKKLRGLGWQAGPLKYWAAAYGAPSLYLPAVYGAIWASGLGGFPNLVFLQSALREMGVSISGSASNNTLLFIVLVMVFDFLPNLVGALGEEIGWRGLLLPELAKTMPLPRATLTLGLIWAMWHYPLILFAGSNNGLPVVFSLACFTGMVVGTSFVYTWLRLRSGSFWPAAILHAQGNLLIGQILDPLTRSTEVSAYFTGEFGLALAIGGAILGYVFHRIIQKSGQGMRGALQEGSRQGTADGEDKASPPTSPYRKGGPRDH